jgi:hypothetical protein
MVAHSVVQLDCDKNPYRLVLENGKPLEARSVVIASGAQYNNPENLNLERFVGQVGIPGQGGRDSEIDSVAIPKLIRSRFREEVGQGFRF